MNKYTDSTKMPFGKHKGEKLANIPADYLLYLYTNYYTSMDPKLRVYIKENYAVLKSEI